MSFDPRPILRGATSRAKSDVANKMVSMLLHELSRRVSQQAGISVSQPKYGQLVWEHFGPACPYCLRHLEGRRIAVEHLEGMNRFRAGLHIPGNVLVSCADCNKEKRRDDQLKSLALAQTGWESFLCHDSSRCEPNCKSCLFWKRVSPDSKTRTTHLRRVRDRILAFQKHPDISPAISIAQPFRDVALRFLEEFYREGQAHAQREIEATAERVEKQLSASSIFTSD